MNVLCDTSALIKKYVIEKGSDKFDKILIEVDNIYVSAITEIETISTFRRLFNKKAINTNEYEFLINEFGIDYQYFNVTSLDSQISNNAIASIHKYQLKTLDSIQLGTAILLRDEIDYFIVCDEKLINAALKENIKILNPNK